MKTVKLFSMTLLLTGILACAQKNEVPKAVTDTFSKKFPAATSVKWEKENDTEWEAEFKMDAIEYSANFESNGTWKETEHEVEMADVPEIVKTVLNNTYPDYKIKESEISETASGMVYEFEIKKGSDEMEISIDKNGNVTKKTEKEEQNDSDDED